MNFKITLIGAGNVATHLGLRLVECGHSIEQVFSRNIQNAKKLAHSLNASPIDDLQAVQSTADIYIIAVKDDVIELIAKFFPFKNKLVVHTSGATQSTVFKPYFERFGVFYPLQTFSKDKKADFETLPICIDANNSDDIDNLKKLGQSICPNIYQIDDRERAILHVCAVMVNNFTNHLYALAADILTKEAISMDILLPLIQETVNKIQIHPPKAMQTGPARRSDELTLDKHLNFLEAHPNVKEIYQILSKSISKMYE